ncbi:hypothetical protein [Bacillus sp. FJAT-49736]|nr:hypothetical protein [Bacillus sp. FJAT-49736]MBS4171910.1 hypothetical protein [Bacillus sp. FJAT-49736]
MNFYHANDFGVFAAKNKFVIVIKGNMYGPFPNEKWMWEKILKLFEE